MDSPVQTAVCSCRWGGASDVVIGAQVSPDGKYCPPVSTVVRPSHPPQTSMRSPAQTAATSDRLAVASTVESTVQKFVSGLYDPPGIGSVVADGLSPLQMSMCVPVQTAACRARAEG